METAFRSFPTRPNFDFKTWSVTQSQKGLLTKRDKKGGEAWNPRLFYIVRMVKVYVVGLPETACVAPFMSVNIALMVADTVCPEVPLYVQVRLNVASSPPAKEPDKVRMLPPVHDTEAVPETASEPLSVTAAP